MPTAFTEEERAVLTEALLECAAQLVREQSARKITVEQLTSSVGISKGAFYLFYPSKEHLFYVQLRRMHIKLYAPALQLLERPQGFVHLSEHTGTCPTFSVCQQPGKVV